MFGVPRRISHHSTSHRMPPHHIHERHLDMLACSVSRHLAETIAISFRSSSMSLTRDSREGCKATMLDYVERRFWCDVCGGRMSRSFKVIQTKHTSLFHLDRFTFHFQFLVHIVWCWDVRYEDVELSWADIFGCTSPTDDRIYLID